MHAPGNGSSADFLPRDWLRYWLPVFLWGLLIWTLSTGLFSDAGTSRWILPALHWLLPNASPRALHHLHHLIRKGAHFTEYFLFSLLLFNGLRRGRPGWRLSWALLAVALAAFWAASDEFHQLFVPSRGPSPFDVLRDICGAAAAQVFAAWRHARNRLTSA